ncbi:MAG: SusD/RagB family nutrient-binding outer membrane lipoprotein [Flavobacteriaceae bacterium]
MKNIYKILVFSSLIFVTSSCEDIVEGINENPNDLTVEDVDEGLFLTGGQLANIQLQCGHLNRISGMYAGQLIGIQALYANIYGYNLTTGESNSEWTALYVGVMTNMRHIIENSESNLLRGIAMIIEAHAFGTAASLWGDVPYSEAGNPDIEDPVFDEQRRVYADVITRLDEGISTLNGASSSPIAEDIYFEGDKSKWIAAAHTLKARFYLHQKDYQNALTAAQNGISSADGDMKFSPGNSVSGDTNLFWTILAGSRAGDLGNNADGKDSYLLQILDASNALSRNHSKTDETARRAYYTIDASGSSNLGIIEEREPQNMVTYFENKLIMAEAAGRSGGVAAGLVHLNDVRTWLNSGGNLNENFDGLSFRYDPFVAADFEAGGIENADGDLTADDAFLREVMEERYVSGFGMHMPYNDARRLRKSDANIAVPYFMVDADNSVKPERMPYARNELNSNSNAPTEDPGIFTKTEVNQ